MNDAVIKWLGLALGWGLIGAGVVIALLALFRDRSRGCRRCPRCWYSMQGVPAMTCPECGRTARKEAAFFRTRRRWRRAVAASILPLLGVGVLATSGLIRLGWQKAIPTTALVLACPVRSADWGQGNAELVLDAGHGSILAASPSPGSTGDEMRIELERRLTTGSLWNWQARLLAYRIASRARAAKVESTRFDVRSILDEAWLPAVKPKRSSTSTDELSNFIEDVGVDSIENDSVQRVVDRMLSGKPSTIIGPNVLWWEAASLEPARVALEAIAAARPGAPAAFDATDWEARLAVYRRLQAAELNTDAETTLEGIAARVQSLSGLPTLINTGPLETQRQVLQERPAPSSRCAVDVLDTDMHWLASLHRTHLRWTVVAGGVVFYIPFLSLHEAHRPYHLSRVYDVRPLLSERMRASPSPDLDAIVAALHTDLDLVAKSPTWMVTQQHVNGRVIIHAEFAEHVAIEEYLRSSPR